MNSMNARDLALAQGEMQEATLLTEGEILQSAAARLGLEVEDEEYGAVQACCKQALAMALGYVGATTLPSQALGCVAELAVGLMGCGVTSVRLGDSSVALGQAKVDETLHRLRPYRKLRW